MKYCPVCSERYDEDVIRFCTKDGTPLVDDAQPSFTALPSETVEEDDDFGQETIVRRKPLVPDEEPIAFDSEGQSERIVIPTSGPQTSQVRSRTAQGFVVPPPPPNTARTVFLTIIGTLFVLGLGVGVFWLLKKDAPAKKDAPDSSKQPAEKSSSAGDAPGNGSSQVSEFGWYRSMLHDRFYKAWEQPKTVVATGAKMSTLVKIRIEKDGRVSKFTIEKPAGNVLVDESVAAIAQHVTRVDPPPAGLVKGDYYEVRINFELNAER